MTLSFRFIRVFTLVCGWATLHAQQIDVVNQGTLITIQQGATVIINGNYTDNSGIASFGTHPKKATTFSEIQPSTFRNYLNELVTKYPKGAELNSSKFPPGTILDGGYKLEIPESNRSFFESSEEFKKVLSDFNRDKGVDIEIIYLAE